MALAAIGRAVGEQHLVREDLVSYFSEFDIIISYLYDPDCIFHDQRGALLHRQFIAAPPRPDPALSLHATQVYLKPLVRLAIFDADSVPRLAISAPATASKNFGSGDFPVLALHPGSGAEHKNWPEWAWAELLQHLVNQTRLNLLLVGGEAEGDRLQRLAAALPPMRTRVAKSQPLTQLAALLAGCDAFVGHDSGISHLAAALGLPGLLLWGATDEEIWRPPSEKVVTLRPPKRFD